MNNQIELIEHNIVLIGDFSPNIFQPFWFSNNQLIKEKEAESAQIKVIHPEIVEFESGWLRVQITRERFLVSTIQEPYFEILRDLVLSTFKLLRYIPLYQMGINLVKLYKMKDEKSWHKIGDKLTPKQIWEGILTKPGLVKVSMRGERIDNINGNINVHVQPDKRTQYGVLFDINSHFEVAQSERKQVTSEQMIDILSGDWKETLDNANRIIQKLIEV